MEKISNKRLEDSFKCIDILKGFLYDNPQLRLEQAIAILDKGVDYFNEEPQETARRWSNEVKKLKTR